MEYSIWLIPIGVIAFLLVARSGGGGSFGKRIRASDHWSWEMAVKDKRRELEVLIEHEPKA